MSEQGKGRKRSYISIDLKSFYASVGTVLPLFLNSKNFHFTTNYTTDRWQQLTPYCHIFHLPLFFTMF